MQKVYLTKISLNNYRNFEQFNVNLSKSTIASKAAHTSKDTQVLASKAKEESLRKPLEESLEESFSDSGVVLITGNNGSGKTNILEAISYLSPGRGIRGAKYEDLCHNKTNNKAHNNWYNQIELRSKLGIANVTYMYDAANRKRSIEYNGSKIGANDLSGLTNVIWLTPQMNDLFIGSRSNRLRFFDRIVFNFFVKHATNINNFDHFSRERLHHLTNNIGNFDSSWLTVLEGQIASHAMLIYNARKKTIEYMQKAIDSLDSEFPTAVLSLTQLFEPALKFAYDYNVESKSDSNEDIINDENHHFIEAYCAQLKKNREKDAYSGRTNFGVHKADFRIIHRGNANDASICSTGEQKAMLISIFLAQIEAIIAEQSVTPILLMDELFVHLDDLRKQYLSDYVINRGVQTFITATDTHGIEQIVKHAQRIIL